MSESLTDKQREALLYEPTCAGCDALRIIDNLEARLARAASRLEAAVLIVSSESDKRIATEARCAELEARLAEKENLIQSLSKHALEAFRGK